MQQKMSQIDPNLILFLIAEELKSRKFFNGLMNVGFDYTPFRPHLDEAIMAALGLDAEQNAVLEFYEHVMETHAEQITEKQEAITREAQKVYEELKARIV
jgi:dsRNA-specific ribonuclease